METYNQICRKLMCTTCKKETHRIVVKAMKKYGEFKNIIFHNKGSN